MHYTDGIKGCGNLLENKLRAVFFKILQKFVNRISKLDEKDKEHGWKLFLAFDCKFLARDFDQLYNGIQIFNVLFRGGKLVTLSHNIFERQTYSKSY